MFNKIINENELIIVILGGLALGGLVIGEIGLVETVVTGLIGFLGGVALGKK